MSYILQKDSGNWSQLCSSLDLIEDTDEAIRAFDPTPTNRQALREYTGHRYLNLYGVLQAMFVQQDAVGHLCESLDIPFRLSDHPRLMHVREIRNASIGHPSRQGWGDKRSHNFLSRITINRPNSIRLLRYFVNGEVKSESIDIEELMADQVEEMGSILKDIEVVLKERVEENRTQFMNEKFTDAFPKTLGYAFEKLNDALRWPERRFEAPWAIEETEILLADFRARLQRQDMDIDTFDSVELVYQELGYPVAELKKYLVDEPSTITDDELAKIVSFYIKAKVYELKRIAEDMDLVDP